MRRTFSIFFFLLDLLDIYTYIYIYTYIVSSNEKRTITKVTIFHLFNLLSSWTKEYTLNVIFIMLNWYKWYKWLVLSSICFDGKDLTLWETCVYARVLNWELGSISAWSVYEIRGVTLWKRNERNRTKQKIGRGRGKKKRKMKREREKKSKKQKWKTLFPPLPSSPLPTAPERKAYFRAFPRSKRSRKKKRKKEKKNVSTNVATYLLSKMDYFVRNLTDTLLS